MDTLEYKVKIEQFEGPLDLLLHLVSKARIDIEEIFVSKVTGQYLEYVAKMREHSMDKASEFLEMAAMLVYIKSRMILPPNEFDEDFEEDPEQELIARLKQYKVFKDASMELIKFEEEALKVYYKLPEEIAYPGEVIVLEEMTMEALIAAYKQVLERIPDSEPERLEEVTVHHHLFTLKDRTTHILRRLSRLGSATFFSLFSDVCSRVEIAVTFLALLELIHENIVLIEQQGLYDDIVITKISGVAV